MVEVFAQADGLTGKGCNAELLPRQRQRLHDHERGRAVPEGQAASRSGTSSPSTIPPAATPPRSSRRSSSRRAARSARCCSRRSGTADFGAKISELGADPAEGLYVTIFGSDAINLAKQQAQFGLFGKYKMVIGNSFVIPQVLPAMGDTTVGRLSDARLRPRRARRAGGSLRQGVSRRSTTARSPPTPPPTNMPRSS